MTGSDAGLLAEFSRSNDPEIREELTRRYMPFARSLALRYRRGSEPLEDLAQVAYLGLIKAIDRFDPNRGTPFQAYAAPTILGELKRHFRDKVMPIHLARGLKERALEITNAAQELPGELDREPTVAELAERAEMSEDEAEEAIRAQEAVRTISLDAPVRTDDGDTPPVIETLGAADQELDLADSRLALRRAFAVLDRRERFVIGLRFASDLTQDEIASKIGVSQVHVSRILRRALDKLRTAVGSSGRPEKLAA